MTQEQLLQELVYPGTNISTIPITILTTILYTNKKLFFLNHNTGTILEYNTGTNFYTSIVHNNSIPVLRSPSTGDPHFFVTYCHDCVKHSVKA